MCRVQVFGAMLERQAQVERIKGVLAMLKRYESLFRLPTRIRCPPLVSLAVARRLARAVASSSSFVPPPQSGSHMHSVLPGSLLFADTTVHTPF